MATPASARRASLVSTSTASSRTSTDSFLDLVKNSIQAATWLQGASRQVTKATVKQAATDRVCDEVVSMLFQCSQCLIRPTKAQRTSWSPLTSAPTKATAKSARSTPRKDLATSLLSYINNQIASARRQGIRLNTLTIVTDDLSVRQLRRLSSSCNNNSKLGSGVRVFSSAIGTWEVRIGAYFEIHLVQSQLRRVAARLKGDLAITLERVSKAIIAQGNKDDATGSGQTLTDLYLLRAYFGTQLWLHDQAPPSQRHQRSAAEQGKKKKKAWYDIAAVSFVEPYINACPQAKAAVQLGRRVGKDMGMSGMGDEDAEVALMNEVLLQVVSPFSGAVG